MWSHPKAIFLLVKATPLQGQLFKMSNTNSKPTFNAVMLPPTALLKIEAEGVTWVKAQFAQLKAPLPGKGAETALTMVTNNKNHLTSVMTPKFTLNGYASPR
ncbi:hypothetical protein E1B28_003328 [Marasmius oreades]|uniref:Uncharacterized protein n=1 Tax=Marasmius oreades TaxID=181124 RepID=A0A9P7UJP3_9AGAR|nr:uncharacterized protein E1B28_003328 [Marasmius oreades]KAG7085787.1 hypothetical protein E1B28_003328 [Marasmius oreades]